MSILADAINRRRRRSPSSPFRDRLEPVPELGQSAPATEAESPEPATDERGRSELARRRDALAEQVTELHWDLGGLTYEMAIRDHFRLDVLVARAAALQERDAELAEVERLLALEESASAGACPACGAPHSRGAVYCWQCGTTLMVRTASGSSPVPASAAPDLAATAPIDALLAVDGSKIGRRGEDGSSHPPRLADR